MLLYTEKDLEAAPKEPWQEHIFTMCNQARIAYSTGEWIWPVSSA